MFGQFYPKEWVDSVYEIPWEEWHRRGIRGATFDIDNTLTRHGAPAGERVIALFARMHEIGIQTYLLSNNREPRVASFAAQVNSPYIYKAGKPSAHSYRQAMAAMGTDASSTLFVGDQLFTDIYGANRAGIYSILVRPIHPKEEIQIMIKRYLEAVVLRSYAKENPDGVPRGLRGKGCSVRALFVTGQPHS